MRITRRVLLNVAVFGLAFAVMLGWAVNQIVSVEQLERPYEISAEFTNAFGIVENAEVTYLGVAFGSVEAVERTPGGVRIDMKIERGKRIPKEAIAAIARKSAIGEPYVDFALPPGTAPSGDHLAPGEVVPRDRTAVPLEFSDLLRSASALVQSIPPQDVGTLVHELAVGLDGRSGDLRQLADASDGLAATFAARTEALDRLATNNTRITHVVAEHRAALGSAITDLRELAATLRAAKGDTTLLLERGSTLLTQAADLVAAQKGNLDCVLKDLEILIDETTTPRRLAELGALLTHGPAAYAGLWDSVDREADGPWLRVGNIANSQHPPAQYVPRKAVPPVRPVPPCRSGLRPANIDYRPGGGPQATAAAPPPAAKSAPAATASQPGRRGDLRAALAGLTLGSLLAAAASMIGIRPTRRGGSHR